MAIQFKRYGMKRIYQGILTVLLLLALCQGAWADWGSWDWSNWGWGLTAKANIYGYGYLSLVPNYGEMFWYQEGTLITTVQLMPSYGEMQ
jgi:hypothetical protein